ncbi:MAG: OmpH family outer membrane protein [Alphaproteobacteria bacterium]|nr:OmpH family outer membrane protein [Alphaproteobacteria bacterium]
MAPLAVLLGAAPALAQAGAPAAPPPRTAPAQAAPAPAAFPAGARIAFVNLQAIAQLSAEGKAASAQVNALVQKKQSEGAEKAKALAANQQKLETGGAVMTEQARADLTREIDRQQREGERFNQDAQAEITDLQQRLQDDFQRKLFPLLEQMAREKGLYALISQQDAGVIWFDPGIDLTADAVRLLDAATAKPKQ